MSQETPCEGSVVSRRSAGMNVTRSEAEAFAQAKLANWKETPGLSPGRMSFCLIKKEPSSWTVLSSIQEELRSSFSW